MESLFSSYLALLETVRGELERLTETTRQKIKAVENDDVLALNDLMNQEQALALKFRGLDQKRERLLQKLGLAGVPLAQLPGRFPAALREKAGRTVQALEEQYRTYRDCAGQARQLLEQNLHEVESMLSALGAVPVEGPGYAPHETPPPPSMKTDFRA